MRRNTFVLWIIIVTLTGALVGVLTYLALFAPALYTQANKLILQKDTVALNSIRKLINTSNAMNYGTVLGVDVPHQIVYVSMKDPFGKAADKTLELHVAVPVYIAHQELLGADNVATGLSRTVISSLADIQPGEHAAFTFTTDDKNQFETHYLLFGDPL